MPALPAFLTPRATGLACALGLLLPAGVQANDCMSLRGGDLVLTGSEACSTQLRRDPALRRQVARTIDVAAAGGAVAAPAAGGREARHGAGSRANLAHPLARLSQLNAQSRYLWSLGNPAPSYYGQTQAR